MVVQNRFLSLEKFASPLEKSAVSLKIEAIPECGPNDVIVRMKFACINPSDMFVVQGLYPGAKSNVDRQLPAKLGFEGSGIVHSVGSNVKSLKKGDKVFPFFSAECGAYSDFIVATEQNVLKLPENIPLEIASQLLINPVTIFAMIETLELKRGDVLLQSAANSTLGRMMIQVCAMKGIKTINIVRRPELVEDLKAIGADHVIISDMQGGGITKQILSLTDGKGVKFAIDAVGGKTGSEIIHSLSQYGTVLLYGLQSGQTSSISNAEVLFKEITIKGFWLAKWLPMKSNDERIAIFSQVLGLLAGKQLIPPVEKTFPLSEFHAAFKDQMENEKGRLGKILFDLSEGVDY